MTDRARPGRELRRVVVVGASVAGVNAAEELRAQGYDGDLVLLGADGRLPHDRPPLSKQFLAGRWEDDRIALRDAGTYDDLDIDLRVDSAATGLDLARRVVHTAAGEELQFDGLVIATGSAARWPGSLPRREGMYTLRCLDDAHALRRDLARAPRVAVLGGGLIGAEVAATARGLGLDVTIIESQPVPMSRALGVEVGEFLADRHRDHGVDVRCGRSVVAVEGADRVEALVLEDGSRIAADVVVIGVGADPVTDWLVSSGLALDDGVVCDAACATSAPGVLAAGDVARWQHPARGSIRLEHHNNAVEQGALVARNLLADPGRREAYAPVPYAWSDQYEHKVQTLGAVVAGGSSRTLHGSVEDGAFVVGFFDRGVLAGAVGVGARRELTRTRALIESGARLDEVTATFPEVQAS